MQSKGCFRQIERIRRILDQLTIECPRNIYTKALYKNKQRNNLIGEN